ncbi:hypothetical protein FB446DRAFT_733317 [Lentinula raphanica]|nr:hypothetical protein FB446DRAFT_733317 [Lentinula raphanica]
MVFNTDDDDDDLKTITAIAHSLDTLLDTVEILPGTVEQWQSNSTTPDPFLLVNKNLGLPQELLHKLYPCALSLFKRARSSVSVNLSSPEAISLLQASSIILLTNPAHQSALNQRKRLIVLEYWSAEQELGFSKLLLSSSRVASKQSIIWDHRRWLFDFQYIVGQNRQGSIPATILQSELETILQSCGLYPRNYYAWAHWEFCMDHCLEACTDPSPTTIEYPSVIATAFNLLLRWMEHHLSDCTAVHHLCRLVERVHTLERIHGQSGQLSHLTFRRLSEQAVSLLSRYTDHETLWMYLRFVWALCGDQVLRQELDDSIASLPKSLYHDKFIDWCSMQH